MKLTKYSICDKNSCLTIYAKSFSDAANKFAESGDWNYCSFNLRMRVVNLETDQYEYKHVEIKNGEIL
jgi:hypothetical protein